MYTVRHATIACRLALLPHPMGQPPISPSTFFPPFNVVGQCRVCEGHGNPGVTSYMCVKQDYPRLCKEMQFYIFQINHIPFIAFAVNSRLHSILLA